MRRVEPGAGCQEPAPLDLDFLINQCSLVEMLPTSEILKMDKILTKEFNQRKWNDPIQPRIRKAMVLIDTEMTNRLSDDGGFLVDVSVE